MRNQIPAMQPANVSHIQATSPQMVQIPARNVPMMQIQLPTTVKKRFSARNKLFKTAMGCLLLCVLLFIVGFSAPAWLNIEGLWKMCYDGECINFSTEDFPLIHAVRALECLALIAFVVCLAVEFRQDFRKVVPFPEENKAVEILAFLAGILGLIGVILYRVEYSDFIGEDGIFVGFEEHIHVRFYLNWGFGLVTAACSLTIVCAACIAYSRVKHAAQTNAALTSQSYAVPQPRMF